MRESYRLQKKHLQAILDENDKSLSLFFIYTGTEIPVYDNVLEKIGEILKNLEKLFVQDNQNKKFTKTKHYFYINFNKSIIEYKYVIKKQNYNALLHN